MAQKGFTLIELMIGLAILAILVSLATPAFKDTFERSRADSDIADLVRALNLARQEAINRGVNVSVDVADANAGWNAGINVTVVGGAALRNIPAMASGSTLVGPNGVTSIVFNNFGGLATPGAAVTLTYSRGSVANKIVAICLTGRIQTGAACS